MKIKEGNKYITLYCLFLLNYILSESHLVDYFVINILLFTSRYAVAGLFTLIIIKKTGLKISKKFFVFGGFFFLTALINMLFYKGGLGIFLLGVVIYALYIADIGVEKLILVTIKSLWGGTAIVVMLCCLGILKDVSGIRYTGASIIPFYDGSTMRHAYGFLSSNLIPLNLFITYIYLIIYKRERITVFEHIIIGILNFIFLFVFGSRVSFLMILATMMAYFVARRASRRRKEKQKKRKVCIWWIIYPVCFGLSLIASLQFSMSKYSWLVINNILMNRLLMTKTAINTFGITVFGSGDDIYNNLIVEGMKSATIDNGYMNLLLHSGVIITVFIMFFWIWLTYRAETAGNFYLVFCLVALAVANLIDAHLTSYKMIPLFVLMFKEYSRVITMYPVKTEKLFRLKGL